MEVDGNRVKLAIWVRVMRSNEEDDSSHFESCSNRSLSKGNGGTVCRGSEMTIIRPDQFI